MSLKHGPATPRNSNGAAPTRRNPLVKNTNVQHQAKTKDSSKLNARKSQNPFK